MSWLLTCLDSCDSSTQKISSWDALAVGLNMFHTGTETLYNMQHHATGVYLKKIQKKTWITYCQNKMPGRVLWHLLKKISWLWLDFRVIKAQYYCYIKPSGWKTSALVVHLCPCTHYKKGWSDYRSFCVLRFGSSTYSPITIYPFLMWVEEVLRTPGSSNQNHEALLLCLAGSCHGLSGGFPQISPKWRPIAACNESSHLLERLK